MRIAATAALTLLAACGSGAAETETPPTTSWG